MVNTFQKIENQLVPIRQMTEGCFSMDSHKGRGKSIEKNEKQINNMTNTFPKSPKTRLSKFFNDEFTGVNEEPEKESNAVFGV